VSRSCTPGTSVHRLRPNNLDTTGSSDSKTAKEPYTPYQGWPQHSWLDRGHLSKKTILRRESHHTRPESFPGAERWLWLPSSEGAVPCGAHPVGHNNKHCTSSTQKVSEHQTPKPFKSGLRGFSPSTRLDDMIPPRDSNLLHQGKANRLRSFHGTR
jgi:hypothetical protein